MHIPQTVKVRRNAKNDDTALTIPKSFRDMIPESEHFKCFVEGNRIIYEPYME